MKKHRLIFEPVYGLPCEAEREARFNRRVVLAAMCFATLLVAFPIGWLVALIQDRFF